MNVKNYAEVIEYWRKHKDEKGCITLDRSHFLNIIEAVRRSEHKVGVKDGIEKQKKEYAIQIKRKAKIAIENLIKDL